jgi:hypothetical protein
MILKLSIKVIVVNLKLVYFVKVQHLYKSDTFFDINML